VVGPRGAVAGHPGSRDPPASARLAASHPPRGAHAADRAGGCFAVSLALEPNTTEAQEATTVYACEPLPKHDRSVVRGRA